MEIKQILAGSVLGFIPWTDLSDCCLCGVFFGWFYQLCSVVVFFEELLVFGVYGE